MIDRVVSLSRERAVRLGCLAGVPPLWFAIAWADPRILVLAVAAAAAGIWVLRSRERRHADDEEPFLL